MQSYYYARRMGLSVILCAAALRLILWLPNLIEQEKTGRDVRFSPSYGSFSPDFVEKGLLIPPEPAEEPLPVFAEAEIPDLYYAATVDPDVRALLESPLTWDLRGSEPTVLILHTHSTESYTHQGENYQEVSDWRTLDEGYNMLSIGALVAEGLNAAGIPTVQDRTLHDYPSYSGSYTHARKTIRSYLEEYPSLRLVLDLHRDASGGDIQMRTSATIAGEPSAQLMVVIGTNHEGYEENLSLGLKLHAQLESRSPGLTRPLQLRSQRFNQDLCSGALLIEVGAAGNSHPEARRAASALTEAIIALSRGTG